MPISKKAFERGMSPREDAIVAFLDNNPDHAYTYAEIAKAVNWNVSSPVDGLAFSLTLISLKNKSLIRSKTIGGVSYYASAKAVSGRTNGS